MRFQAHSQQEHGVFVNVIYCLKVIAIASPKHYVASDMGLVRKRTSMNIRTAIYRTATDLQRNNYVPRNPRHVGSKAVAEDGTSESRMPFWEKRGMIGHAVFVPLSFLLFSFQRLLVEAHILHWKSLTAEIACSCSKKDV